MFRRFTLLLVIPALVVTVAGCGSKKSAPTTTTSTTAPSPDLVTAQKLVIGQGDLPGGWGAGQNPEGDESNLATGVYNQLTSCADRSISPGDRTVLYSGAVFTQNGNAVASSASAYKTPEQVTAQIAGIKNPANFDCITSLINGIVSRAVSSGAAGIPTSSVTTIPGVTTQPDEFALRIKVALGSATTTSGVSTGLDARTVYVDIVGVGKDRFISTATFAFLNDPPPADLEQTVLQKLALHAQVLG